LEGILGEPQAAEAEQRPAAGERPVEGAAGGGYRYEVQLHPRSGPFRRWRGRVITTDGAGKRHHWRWRSSFSRDHLMASLWEETMLDIKWRTGGASAVEIVDFD
jgi:hypothetical protein